MAKKPKTIGSYQKKIKELKRVNKFYTEVILAFVESKDDAELIQRVSDYKKTLGL